MLPAVHHAIFLAHVNAPSRATWLVFLFSILIQVVAFDTALELYDEGIILTGAERVLQGDLPYRDFWTMYAPGTFYLVAGLFNFIGTSELVVRGVGIVSKAAITAFAYSIVRGYAPGIPSSLVALLVLLFLISVRNDAFPLFPAVALAMATLILVGKGLKQSQPFRTFSAAGACTGLVALFRHDLGAYTAATVVVGALLFYLLSPRNRFSPQDSATFAILRILGPYFLGILIVALPPIGFLLMFVPLGDLYFSLIEIPSTVYPEVRSLPFPGFSSLREAWPGMSGLNVFAVYLPLVAVGWVVVQELYLYRNKGRLAERSEAATNSRILIGLVLLACVVFSAKGLVRVSPLHMSQSIILAIVLCGVAASRFPWRDSSARWIFGSVGLFSVLLLVPSVYAGAQFAVDGSRAWVFDPKVRIGACVDPQLPRLHCVRADADYVAAARYIRQHSEVDDTIYVGVERHDRIFVNAVALYFMAERASATKWHELHPGIQTEAVIQKQMVSEMQVHLPRFVVLDGRWEAIREPNRSRYSSGVRILDDFIGRNFSEVVRFGTVRVLEPD